MPVVEEPAPITRVFGILRDGMKRHTFVAGNFFITQMLNRYRADLEVTALPQELNAASDDIVRFLQTKAARVSIDSVQVSGGHLDADVSVENLSGHKLPSAYPSRRAWLHVTVRDRNDRVLFESGKLRPDGSIVGNDNDADPHRYEPHYSKITDSEQVQIYEDILGDPNGQVTTGLLQAVNYLKDNRLLPHGFDKGTTDRDIAVVGDAKNDPNFTDNGARVRYSIDVRDAQGPLRVEAELVYQPIGYRWANNLKSYGNQAEPKRFNTYYDSMGPATAQVIAHAARNQ